MAKSIEFFGLDLGDYSIKAAYTKKSGNSIKIESIGRVQTLPGILTNDSDEGIEELATYIKNLLSASGISTRNCVMSIPEQIVFSRLLRIPKVEDENIEESIHWGIKPLVPSPLENVSIAYTDINKTVVNGTTYIDWYVVAAPKDAVKKYQKVAKIANLNLLAVETEALATARFVSICNKVVDDILIFDLGALSSNIILSRNGITMYSQAVSTGADAFTKIIAAEFGVDEENAELVKRQLENQSPENIDKILKAIEPVIDMMIAEINRTLIYYKEKLSTNKLSQVYLTGGGASMPRIVSIFKERLNIDVILCEPEKTMSISKNVNKAIEGGSLDSYNVAIGLSVKGII